jgi:cyclic pyranopterin phosphate synthase
VEFTHLDEKGRARMVDVTLKEVSLREARAEAFVHMKPETLKKIYEGEVEKGDVLAVGRLGGIMGAKKTWELIPLCHPLEISLVEVNFEPLFEAGILRVETRVKVWGRTGAEMEAMVGGAMACLAIYDMIKAIDRQAFVRGLRLIEKSGGKSGHFKAPSYVGEVLAVNLAEQKGMPKRNVKEAILEKGYGLLGDAHSHSERPLSIFPIEALAFAPKEVLESLKEGEYSENLTIRGIPLEELRVGRRLRIGEALVEITQIGKGKLEPSGRPWIVSREGRFGVVLEGGRVKVGDRVELL